MLKDQHHANQNTNPDSKRLSQQQDGKIATVMPIVPSNSVLNNLRMLHVTNLRVTLFSFPFPSAFVTQNRLSSIFEDGERRKVLASIQADLSWVA